MSEWWLSRGDGKTEGPLSTRALVDGLVAGDIPKRSHVCMVGQQQWHLVSQVEEIWEAVDPSESRTSVTETPWFVDRTDSGKHKLVDADATRDEQTKLTPPNSLGPRPRSAKPEVTDVKVGSSGLPERRPDAPTVNLPERRPDAPMKQSAAMSNPVTAAARPSHAPPVPKRGSTEATLVKPSQQPAPIRPSPAPPIRARSSAVNSPAPLDSSALAPRSSIASDAAPQRASAVPTNPHPTEAAPRASAPDLSGGSRPSSPGPLAAGLTPLRLKAQEPLLAAARPFAGLAGLSPLPGAVSLHNSRQQPQPSHHDSLSPERGSGARAEPSKPALADPTRPSTPPASRNLYGASPLSGARERAATLERRAPSPPSATPHPAQPADLS
ncbi:MAG TPA: hypothetical protein VKP30_15615, partial [Polyangiaceae bacterium]|nr:hypothetical protein [Polyangiaceae bacterium]